MQTEPRTDATGLATPRDVRIGQARQPSTGSVPEPPNIFVIPAYNEEENLPRLFADLESRPELFRGAAAA